MRTAHNIFSDSLIRTKVKRQFRLIQHHNVNVWDVMGRITDALSEKYSVTKRDSTEISIRVDKKKNAPAIEAEVRRAIVVGINNDLIKPSYLFKVYTTTSEIIVRVKRCNG